MSQNWSVFVPAPVDMSETIRVKNRPLTIESALAEITAFSVFNPPRIGWNYTIDYIETIKAFDDIFEYGMNVYDIGCGPSPLHKYLEMTYNINIIGIDTNRWSEGDCVDDQGSLFLDKSFTDRVFSRRGKPDLILSCSAFEHLPLALHKECISSIEAISARSIITTCIGLFGKRIPSANQISLSIKDIQDIYNYVPTVEFMQSVKGASLRYLENSSLKEDYIKRFGRQSKRLQFLDFSKGCIKYRTSGTFTTDYPQYMTLLCKSR